MAKRTYFYRFIKAERIPKSGDRLSARWRSTFRLFELHPTKGWRRCNQDSNRLLITERPFKAGAIFAAKVA